MNPFLKNVPRGLRRNLINKERKSRACGEWGLWEEFHFPRGTVGRGWAADFDHAFRNKVFCVLVRTLPDETRHFAVSSLSGDRPSWHEMQRIKDELAGRPATAVEVYPPHDEIVDEADMFHIWILPRPLPFGLSRPTPALEAA